ncbi:MAG: carbon-nitrogen hydrolase family protein [Polyangiaceae bacterium]|nr:carbon-nitrogen hydrolase family protein [Polyangiaceae bacterium]
MTPQELTVAAVQLESQASLDDNLEAVTRLSRRAATSGAELVVLPENFAYMGSEEDKRELAEPVLVEASPSDGPILCALRALARDTGAFIIGGGMPERSADPERPFNTSVLVAPDGRVTASYRKIHLFDVSVGDGQLYRESASTSAGERSVVGDVRGVPVGLTVCYDLRFPELFRKLADGGARVATVPAAFTLMTGKDHWHVLLRARAIESQMFVVAAAQCGRHPRGRMTYGKSCVIDPWGDVIAQASDGPGFVLRALDLGRVDAVRESLPCLTHRRPIG